jgi:TrmH family RNA methyltransferase
VAEGEDLLAAADLHGWQPVERYCAAGSGLPGVEVDAKALASLSGLASGTRTLGVYEERWAPAAVGPLCVALWGVHDPGNVGAVMRGALAFGASSVVIGPGTADPFGPKAVRGSMGAVFGVPLMKASDVSELLGTKIALVAMEGAPIWRTGFGSSPGADLAPGDVTLLVGSEREGLPADAVAASDVTAHIPIRSDSLNAAMAVTVALYELTRMAPR